MSLILQTKIIKQGEPELMKSLILILNIYSETNQWRDSTTGPLWSCPLVCVKIIAAAFCTCFVFFLGLILVYSELQ